jgi:hypothetical protein
MACVGPSPIADEHNSIFRGVHGGRRDAFQQDTDDGVQRIQFSKRKSSYKINVQPVVDFGDSDEDVTNVLRLVRAGDGARVLSVVQRADENKDGVAVYIFGGPPGFRRLVQEDVQVVDDSLHRANKRYRSGNRWN